MVSIGPFDDSMKHSLGAITPLLPTWISLLIEDCKQEEEKEEKWPVQLLSSHARKCMWKMCNGLNISKSFEIPGQACRLLERYLAAQLRRYSVLRVARQEWEILAKRLPLLMASCIQLSVKMNSRQQQLKPDVIQTYLQTKGIDFSIDEIKDSEFKVYSVLGFRIPMWTCVDMAQSLAVYVGVPHRLLSKIGMLVNHAEYMRDVLDQKVQYFIVHNMSSCNKKHTHPARLRTMYLAAGCVRAITRDCRWENYDGPDPLPLLAKTLRIPLCYLLCLSNMILLNILFYCHCFRTNQAIKRPNQYIEAFRAKQPRLK